MKVTSKNVAKLRRELEEGDVVTFTGLGRLVTTEFRGTVVWPGDRGPAGFATVGGSPLASYPISVDYHRITTWERNR